MAMSVQRLFPGTQVTVGPWIEHGFFYDFDMPEPISNSDLKKIQKEMQKIIRLKLPFIREEVGTRAPKKPSLQFISLLDGSEYPAPCWKTCLY